MNGYSVRSYDPLVGLRKSKNGTDDRRCGVSDADDGGQSVNYDDKRIIF
jgi:hypothetical protein